VRSAFTHAGTTQVVSAMQVAQAPTEQWDGPGPSSQTKHFLSQNALPDKVAARRAVLERRAVAKATTSKQEDRGDNAVGGERQNSKVAESSQSPGQSAKATEKARKAVEKEQAKQVAAAERMQAKQAKAIESRMRGSQANQEITVVLDSKLALCERKRVILNALDVHDVKFRQEVKGGKLPGWTTITWKRRFLSDVRPTNLATLGRCQ
jgi:hypothetical protein